MLKNLFLIVIIALTLPVVAQDDERVPPQDLADENGKFIELDGVEFYYIEAGDPENPTVMLLHGFGGSTVTWNQTIPALVDAGYHVIAYDRPPFGLSDKSPDIDFSPQAMADQTAALMDALDIDSATLVGHSSGGGIISYFAVAYPNRVDALVYVAGAVSSGDITEEDQDAGDESDSSTPLGNMFSLIQNLDPNDPTSQRLVARFLTPEQFTNILRSAYHPDFDVPESTIIAYQRPLRVEGWEAGLLAYFQYRGDNISPLDLQALGSLDTPVALMWGEQDTWVPITRGEWLLENVFPNASWYSYPDVGHLPMEETVEAFNTDLIDFLNNISLNR